MTLMGIFTLATLGRLLAVMVEDGLEWPMLEYSLWSLPAVFIATYAGQRLRPNLSDMSMRRLAFGLLGLLGISLLW